MSGRYLRSDFALPCPPGLAIPEEQRYTITANTLKVSAHEPGVSTPRPRWVGPPSPLLPARGPLCGEWPRALFLKGFPPPQTLLLLGCFAVFWTFYYMLEVCLTRNNVGLDLACNGSTACKWYQPGGKHRALESSLEMEAVPLYREKDLEDVEMECEHPQPAREGEGQEGPWTPTHPKPPGSGRATGFAEAAPASAGFRGREAAPELLSEDREHQAC